MENITETKLEDLSNNELLMKIKSFEIEYESLKQSMLKDFDKMVEIEKDSKRARQILG